MDDHSTMPPTAAPMRAVNKYWDGGEDYPLPTSHGANEFPINRTVLIKITDAEQLTAYMRGYNNLDLSGNMEALMAAITRWSGMPLNAHAPNWIGTSHPFDIDCSHLPYTADKATFVCIYLSDPQYYFDPDPEQAIRLLETTATSKLCNPQLWGASDPTPKFLTFKAEPGDYYHTFNLLFRKDSDGSPLKIDPKIKNNGTSGGHVPPVPGQ